MFLIVICASLFALQKGKVTTKSDLIYYSSLIFAVIAVTLRYISILYNKTKYPVTTENDLVRPAQVFMEAFEVATDETVSDQKSDPASPRTARPDDFDERFREATEESNDNR
ncbi:hypothetical protein WJ86_14630 [Burkholderia multivorans]|nr:hypothetical protein WJ86_14630 [Burkholderia multivorans]